MTDGGGIIESLRREQKWLESIIGKLEPPDGKMIIVGNPTPRRDWVRRNAFTENGQGEERWRNELRSIWPSR